MKKPLVLTLLCFWSLSVFSQSDTTGAATVKDTSYWQKSFSGGINFNQAAFSNWLGGGVNSVALGSLVAWRALYQKDKITWDNTADLQLGYIAQRGESRKAADQIFINSVLGRAIAPKWEANLVGTFTSFFAPGYDYVKVPRDGGRVLVSRFLSPAQLTLALGVGYKPNDWFSIRFSPFAPRFTFVTDDAVRVREANGVLIPDPRVKAFGVEPGQTVRTEWLAAQIQAALNRNLTENISLNIRYQLYANYQMLDAIDHRLDFLLAAKLNKYLSTTVGLIALYDEDFSDQMQLQQTLAIGLLYNMSTFRKKQ